MFFNMRGEGGWLGIFPSPKAYMGGEAQNLSNFQSLYRGGGASTTMSYVLSAHGSCLGRSAYWCKFTGRVWSLYGGDKRVTPRTSLLSVLRQQDVIE